jgi:hypothetical protein
MIASRSGRLDSGGAGSIRFITPPWFQSEETEYDAVRWREEGVVSGNWSHLRVFERGSGYIYPDLLGFGPIALQCIFAVRVRLAGWACRGEITH